MTAIKTLSQLNAAYPPILAAGHSGNTGIDNITTALRLLQLTAAAINNADYTEPGELLTNVGVQLYLVEKFLEAGTSWARDADTYLTEAEFREADRARQ